MSKTSEKYVLTRKEVAEGFGVSLVTLDREIREGNLRVLRLGRRVLISHEEVERFLAGKAA